MSLTHPPRYPGPPPPNPNYPYPHPQRVVENPNSREPQPVPVPVTVPVLPPMSSLLPRHERMEPGPTHNTHPYPPPPPPPPPQSQQHPYPAPPPQDSRHPLWLAESNPAAPVQHLYQQAPSHPPASHSPHYRQDPVSKSSPTRSPLNVQQPHEYPSQPARQRQHRRISQRSDDPPKEGELSVSPIRAQNPYQAPPIPYHPQYQFQGQSTQASPSVSTPPASSQPSTTNAMHISGLLSAHPGPQPARRAPPKYLVRMRQQPLAARACGFGERDRRVIDPPPILQMTVEDPIATPDEIRTMIRQPCAVVHCTLWDPVADKDDTAMPGTTDKRQQRRLMGTLVSSPFVGKDEHGIEGCFFTFPDLSVRTPGKYSLRFSLMIIDPTQMCTGNSVPVSSVVFSDPFNVYNAKDFGGMRPSTELTKKLKHQGCLISVKKGNAKTGSNAREEEEEEEEEEDEEMDGDEKKARRPSKRAKR